MKKKVAIILVVVDIIVLVIIYLAIHHFEQTNPEEMNGGQVHQTVKKNDASDQSQTDRMQQNGDNSVDNNSTADESNADDTIENNAAGESEETASSADNNIAAGSVSGTLPEIITRQTPKNEKKNIFTSDNGTIYNLHIADSAGHSRFFELLVSNDGGATWSVLNADPFNGKSGEQNGVFFLNENIGFIVHLESNGESGTLYRTQDGGATFTPVSLPQFTREMYPGAGSYYEPYDMPEAPYVEDGELLMEYGQGSTGDYNGGSSVILKSDDQGISWTFVKEAIIKDYEG